MPMGDEYGPPGTMDENQFSNSTLSMAEYEGYQNTMNSAQQQQSFDPNALSTDPNLPPMGKAEMGTPEAEAPSGGKKKKGKKKGKKGKKGKGGQNPSLMPDPSAPENLPPGYAGRGDFGDPNNVFLSTVPLMNQVRDYQIGDSMAQAGFTGNRYSSDAMNQAGRIGGETTLALQSKLNELLYGQSNQDLDRALQAAIAGGNLGMDINSLTQSRVGAQGQLASSDQARADAAARARFSAMNQPEPDNYSRIMDIIRTVGSMPGDTNVQNVSGQEPGLGDYASDALAIYLQGDEAGLW